MNAPYILYLAVTRMNNEVFQHPPKGPKKVLPFFVRQFLNYTDYLRPQRWNWSILVKPLDDQVRKDSGPGLVREKLVGLRYFLLDGVFATISDNIFVNYVVLFALAYSATNSQIGLLTAFANLLGTVSLFPGARAVERFGRKKAIVVGFGGIGSRLFILLLAVIPFFYRSGIIPIILILIFHGIRSFFGNFANPAWTSMVAELVPDSIRGRYFGSRNTAMEIAALVVAPIAGFIIRHFNGMGNNPFYGFQIVFVLAFLFGMISTAFFSKIPESVSGGSTKYVHAKGDLRKALKSNPTFVGFLVSAFVWNIAIQLSAPFFNVHMVRNLGANISEVGIAAGFASCATLLGMMFFGRLLREGNTIKIQGLTGLFIPLLPLLWIAAAEPWHIYLINMFGSFLWAGYNLTNFNLLLQLSPEHQRPRAVALYQTVVFSSAVIGPAIGGYIADIASFKFIFALSSAGRGVGILLFLVLVVRLVRKKSKPVPVVAATL